jgi:hypothetical protein
MTFNPKDHLTTLKGKEYLECRWRVAWLRSEHPEALIETMLMRESDTAALFKAVVTIPDGGFATGWGSETKSDFTDFLEKAETKALARALAHLGFGTQFAIELDEADTPADSPIERRKSSRPTPTAGSSIRREPPQPAPDATLPAHLAGISAPMDDATYAAMQSCTAALKRARERGDSWEQSDIDDVTMRLWKITGAKNLTEAQLLDLCDLFNGKTRFIHEPDGPPQLLPNEPTPDDGRLPLEGVPFDEPVKA